MKNNKFNVIILGKSYVGKTTIFNRYVNGNFCEKFDPTSEDTLSKCVQLDKTNYDVDFIDTFSNCGFHSLIDYLISLSDVFVIVYAINYRESFDEITQIHQNIVNILHKNHKECLPIVICGNKSDLEMDRRVSFDEGQQMANDLNCLFFETSAKNNINVTEALENVMLTYIEKINKENSRINNEMIIEEKIRCTTV
ncbi:GTP-binding protein Rhes precursor, putative [Entamoeba invadens IP1]|uniref:GTP-binding protein Rhes, putative n=1 Tax=Entamoeba invadens IP1 TaxID=370355 RepID=A0A0A1UFZ0_ENTIV|nr:GTP-binding protein Rhes precursor, putative [Entamoeba invadens IP1]ELP94290.1 GTP-binding protein Rhes precursor, putative [Entamoeba invadens IP1]|eukprot:XP_004261061.1 GTP-binding protein Rhes precursor, putative [Entamoeba invadens IP1]